MSTFTFAISCLTTSNLPWFMDLTFRVPMHYCSLQHWTLLPLPVTSSTGCYFCFGSISSFFLELFLHWSPVAYWSATDLGSSSFNVLSFLPFPTVHGDLKARILKWFAVPFSTDSCGKLYFLKMFSLIPHYLFFTISLWQSLHLVLYDFGSPCL